MILPIAIALVIFASIEARVINENSCQLTVDYRNGSIKDPQPLVLSKGKNRITFRYSNNRSGILNLLTGETIYLACPGAGNYIKGIDSLENKRISEIEAMCLHKTIFVINSAEVNLNITTCNFLPAHEARRTSEKCYNNNTHIEIGFQLENKFVRTIEVCRNDSTFMTYYTKFHMTKKIGNVQNYPRSRNWLSGDFYGKFNMNLYYRTETQLSTISKLVGSMKLAQKYILENKRYLSRGHLVAKADFVYGSAQRSTFWYLNAAPQWQSFNGGNWNILEDNIRRFADNNLLNLDVYTGVHGHTYLTDVNNNQIPLYLFVNGTQKRIPVPRFFWKVIYDPLSMSGTAFVGVNDPYALNITEDMYMCQDISSSIKWLNWNTKSITKGVSYACAIDDLRKTVTSIPELKVHGVLK